LVFTAFDDKEHVSALLQAGATGYLLKDVSIDTLLQAVRDVYAGESVLHPAIADKVEWKRTQSTRPQRNSNTIPLSEAELEILRLAARWMTDQEIAHELTYSAHVVQAHLANIYARLGVSSRTEAVLYALKKGWLP
jgi:DNA-binding NarL/FixJ family response regulator